MKKLKKSFQPEQVQGGTLSKKENPEKLDKFTKNTKQKRIVINIIGIILLIGRIILYRSYALYEEEQEFNVLKGTIPDFEYDIKIIWKRMLSQLSEAMY